MKRRAVGLDAGGTKLAAALVHDDGAVARRTVRTWPVSATRDQVLDCVAAAAREILDDASDVVGIGAGLPASIDRATGSVISCRHLPLRGFAFRDWLADAIGVPVLVDNDATLAMLGEHRAGAARGASDAVMLTIGTGIGGGLLVDGRIARGVHGAAGEPGHMTIDADGPRCPGDCPGRGCLEAYVSGPVLAQMGREYAAMAPDYNLGRVLAEKGDLTGADVVAAARAGDPGAHEALMRMGGTLGTGLAGLVNLLDPEVIVIGGGLGVGAGPLLLGPAESAVRERALEPGRGKVRIEPAALGADAGLVGAGLLALEGSEP
jgi:glucokinase